MGAAKSDDLDQGGKRLTEDNILKLTQCYNRTRTAVFFSFAVASAPMHFSVLLRLQISITCFNRNKSNRNNMLFGGFFSIITTEKVNLYLSLVWR